MLQHGIYFVRAISLLPWWVGWIWNY